MNHLTGQLPEVLTNEYCQNIIRRMKEREGELTGLPHNLIIDILVKGTEYLRLTDNLIKIEPEKKDDDHYFIIVGDLHGQFNDLIKIFDKFGYPTKQHVYILLGDYVDRGIDGLEILVTMSILKLTEPQSIYFLRGNHESLAMNSLYGFTDEIKSKFPQDYNSVLDACGEFYKSLPLAAVVANSAFCAHGGIFSRNELTQPGFIEEINSIDRFIDEDSNNPISLFNQLLWSDPELADGFKKNDFRGVGIVWGSKQSNLFLQQNHLKFIIRAHESPEARCIRVRYRLGGMQDGYVQDHCTCEGGAYTLYSAPCDKVCIQGVIQPCLGAVAVLLYPYNELCFQQFS
ncbi:ser/thr protein phosphatase 5, putative [Entamoeba histolytica HM-1:IMSS-B]|uniref:Serine/threonine-protein phosphatase n=6 Tax=Entamoeba histolytica TaxID=5759 RepID=C4LYR7_ENTH1|nr:ser/thr protein phosphatase 5, putative [Entamoeba histolytica HM-1:IMSS]EMD43189.1 serine/threonine protein phosphatase PP1, putative [Entamoeba histolytica KU27]EMH72944.1 ser/thr protein phosphatase 5, putative [Entamoeba histolytica HM-1:IMSS-B]EMS15384.1 serine/threonine protein phosphatase PP1, putative [Entamoeba histolytica HM-3:IMSS]ENY61442.1 serine/threonine protein phosphatase PP1, putative [Entamoeba histolytica HM-1:IMSS-A]GAT93979.1 Ser Thr protein phosphatase 5 putative [Ent|eukprot:XP_650003.1 ser/thr protein phosphatase 5, putative [Entamoeba histolytica HM-1:IMSS]